MPAELSEQIQRFEEKYAENPDSLVFARLADLYRKAGDADRGLRLLQEGLERHPDYLSAHIVRGRCLRDLGRHGEAEEAFERVLDQDEQNLVALRSLAEIARERGDVDEAEQRYEELLALDPHNEEARSALEDLVEGGASPAPPSDEASAFGRGDTDAGGGPQEDVGAGATEAPAADDGAAGPGRREDDEGEEPWWASDEPEEPVAAEGPDASGESAPSGADQDDVFSLAGPEDGETGDAGGGQTEPAGDPGAAEAASREEAEFLGLDGAEGDDSGGRDDAADGGLPAEEELTERIEEIADTADADVPPVPEEGDPDAEDLLTETLADLYETQGFYREAVEMYEELLEERPGDEELRARLEAARSAMDEAGTEEEAVAAPEVRPGDGPDVDAASGEEAPSDDDVTGGREPTSARAHLRALLRGEAGARSSVSEGPDPGP